MRAGTEMGLIHRLGGGFGSSYRLGIGCSVTADQNEITAKRRVSGYLAHFSRQSSSMLTRDVRRSSSGGTIVAMMQTTQPWHRCHLVTDAGSFPCFTTRRRFLFQREMCAILEIVADVFFHEAFQMPLIENDHVVEQIPVQRNTVRSERSNPSIFSSLWIRGAPHVEFSATMRKISSRNSLLTHFLPARTRRCESHVQYSLNPARCQRTQVSGWTKINVCIRSGQSRRKITQNSLSEVETCGRGYRCFITTGCWRSVKFSSSRSRRERKIRIRQTT